MGCGDEWIVIANAPGMSNLFWAPIIELLHTKYRILLWDYRGIHPSGIPSDPNALTVKEHALDLGRILDHLGIAAAHFVGWCIGPRVLVECYNNIPNQFASLSLMNFSYNVLSEWDEVTGFDRLMLGLSERLMKKPEAGRIIAKIVRSYQESDFDRVMEYMQESDVGDEIAGILERLGTQSQVADLSINRLHNDEDIINYFKIYRSFLDFNTIDTLCRMTVPVMIFAGGRDTWTPPRVLRRLADVIAKSQYVELENGTHYLLLEYPKKVSQILVRFFIECSISNSQRSHARAREG